MHATPFDAWGWVKNRLRVNVETERLPDDLMGRWEPDRRTIVLDDRLTPVEELCTLVHEAVHASRDDCGLGGEGRDGDRLEVRQERTVHRITARLLVDLAPLAAALATTVSLADAAEELGVDEDTLWHRLQALDDDEKAYLQDRVDMIEEASWPTN